MFNFLKKKTYQEPDPKLRDLLFGDLPFSDWAKKDECEPWSLFYSARLNLESGERQSAIDILRTITRMEKLESRHYLQAWHYLKELGIFPEDSLKKKVYGVVVEAGLDNGVDIVAAYEDGCARYYNYSGAAIIWEPNTTDSIINSKIEELLKQGRNTVTMIGPWEGRRPSSPTKGIVRLNMLTPSGLHFGEGSFNALSKDPLGAPIIQAAYVLMDNLMKVTQGLNK